MNFSRTARFPSQFDLFTKSAKALGLVVTSTTAIGTWRSLNPSPDGYVDFEGPFSVVRGKGPVFVRDDGSEVFMLNDTAGVQFQFEVAP